jgi:putative sigma-54 modulation protein
MTMQIDIQSRKFSLTRALRDHVERRMRFISGDRYDNIRRVLVRLSDTNGPRGGKDKRCLIQLKLSGQPDVVIEDTRSNLYAAIDRATARVGQAVARRLTRQKHKKRGRSAQKEQLSYGILEADFSAS